MTPRPLRPWLVSLTFALALACAAFAAVHALTTHDLPRVPSSSLEFLPAASTTQDPRISFGQGSYLQLVDPDGRRSIDFYLTMPQADVPFTLHALPETRFRAIYDTVQTWQPLSIDLTGLTLVTRWTASVTAQNGQARTKLPADVTPGLYVLSTGNDPNTRAQLILVVTRYVALLKGGDGQVGIWVQRLQGSLPPTAGAQIELVKGNATVAHLTTDATGWASADLTWDDKMLALVRVGSELTVVGFRYEWQNDWSRWWGGGLSSYQDRRAYLYTDRPIYRPDQDVHYKAILRQGRDGAYTLPDPTDAVTVTLKDPRSNIVATRRHTPGDLGSLDGTFRLGQEASLGTYQLELVHREATYTRSFEAQAYRKPEFEVKVNATPNPVILGDSLSVTVQADYYFAAPVPNAPVTVKLLYGYGWWGGQQVLTQVNGVTDAQGRWTGSLPTGNTSSYDTLLTIEASVTDATAQVVTSQTSVQGHWSSLTVDTVQRRYSYQPGDTVSLTFTVRDRQDRLVGGQAVDVTLTRYFGRDPLRTTRTLVTDHAGTVTFTLDNADQGWYSVEAVTRDGRGREARAYGYFWVFDARSGGWAVQDDRIEVQADAQAYKPGDTARLLVRSPVTGPALLTLERGRVRREQVVELTGAATVIEVALGEDDAPNVYARIHVWQPFEDDRPATWTAVPEGQLLQSSPIELPVAADAKRLTVAIQADKTEYRPGDTAQLTIDVKNHAGQGQRADLSIALVDEAIYALAADTTPNIFDHFHGRRYHAVSGWDSLRPTRYPGLRDTLPAPAPTGTPSVGATPAPAAPREGGQSSVRQDFRDTAYWNARVVTDAQGRATVAVPLPDNLTRWRIVVRAVTAETLAGQGQGELLVTKPVAVSPGMPRFLILGDRVGLDTVVTNRTRADITASVNLTGTGLLRLTGPLPQLVVPAGGQRHVSWSAVASQVGPGTLYCEADAGAAPLAPPTPQNWGEKGRPEGQGGLYDAIATPLPIYPFAIPERQAQAGQVEGTVDLKFIVPLNAVSENSVAELRLSPSIALSLLDGLADLVGYPYGCVEQTMSRVLPNAAVTQTYRRLGISNPDLERRLPDIMADGLQRLYGFQRPDGGWGWWYDDESAIYQTSYVLFGLLQVEAAGFDVSAPVLQRGLDWLENALATAPNTPPTATPEVPRVPTRSPTATATPVLRGDTGLDPRLRAYALYVLALSGRYHLDQATTIFAMNNLHDPFTYAALALTFHLGGDSTSARAATETLVSLAVETPGGVHWVAPRDDSYAWRTMQSDEKTTGMALRALAQVIPTSRLLPGAARWLMDRRQEGGGWATTQASAFAILGLTDYILVSGELDADYTWRVTRDGAVLAQGQVNRATATQPIPPITLRGTDLTPGENTLRIEKTGPGRLYYTLGIRLSLFYPEFEPVASAGTGIRLDRRYSLSEPAPGRATPPPAASATPTPGRGTAFPFPILTPTPTRPPQTEYSLGDVVEVKLVVELPEDMHYLLIEDRLPAGFEPLQERLNQYVWDDGPWRPIPIWRDYGYNRKELRDDRVTFFVTWLGAGRHEFTYRMRATRPGLFSALPAEAYPMYRPDIWGRSASDQLIVERVAFIDPAPMTVDLDRSCRVTDFDVRQMVHAWMTNDQRLKTGNRHQGLSLQSSVLVEDVARALANMGRTCLDGETPMLAPVAISPRLRLVPRVVEPVIGQSLAVDVMLEGAAQTRGYEASLSVPPHLVRMDSVDVMAGAVTLGALIDQTRGRAMWGVVLAEPSPGEGVVVATLHLTPLHVGALDLTLADARVLDAHGQPHTPILDGARLIVGGFRLWLPSILHGWAR